MGEAKKEKERISREIADTGIWKVTDGAEKVIRKRELEIEKVRKIIEGLKRCPVCEGKAKLVIFGLGGNGVWIGCDRTERCARNIEYHEEGWSIEEVAAEWNRYNSGIYLIIRKVKQWIEFRYGRLARARRKVAEENRAKEMEKEDFMRKVFGIEEEKREKWYMRILWKFRKGKKKCKAE